jgi:hypothetical protein
LSRPLIPFAQRAAITIQLCVRGHFARLAMRQKLGIMQSAKPRSRYTLRLVRRMSMAADSAAAGGDEMNTAPARTSKMTLQEAAWNVVFVNVLLNRTFLRSRQEQMKMEGTVRASFPCFEGVASVFLNELMAIARVCHARSRVSSSTETVT